MVWLVLAERFGPRAYGDTWPKRRAQVSSLFMFVTLHSFVIYARADETHIYQTLVPIVIALFVVLSQLEAFLRTFAKSPTAYLPFRAAVGGFGALYASTIAVVPTFDCFDLSRTDWHDPKLVHLRYRVAHQPHDYRQQHEGGQRRQQADAGLRAIESAPTHRTSFGRDQRRVPAR